MQYHHKAYVTNLDTALQMIAQVGIVYHSLKCSDQKELLRHIVSRVVIDQEEKICLELRAPFSYLHDISDRVKGSSGILVSQGTEKEKTSEEVSTGFSRTECLLTALFCGKEKNLTEHSKHDSLHFLGLIAFPQRADLARFSTSP